MEPILVPRSLVPTKIGSGTSRTVLLVPTGSVFQNPPPLGRGLTHVCVPPAERRRPAQPERLHPTEVSDQQVCVQQLQLGGQLTSRGGTPPTSPVGRTAGLDALPAEPSPHVNSLLLLQPRPWSGGGQAGGGMEAKGFYKMKQEFVFQTPPSLPLACNIELFSKRTNIS